MSEEIKNVKLSFSCSEDWDGMTQTDDGGKHCDKCQKKVYDFTNSKVDEFRIVLAQNNYMVCGKFSSQQTFNKQKSKQLFLKKWLSAAIVLLGINLWNNRAVAQHKKPKLNIQKKLEYDDVPVVGEVLSPEPLPEYPGGYEKFNTFILKNLHAPAGAHGRVVVQLTIEKDGQLTNAKILGSIGKAADNEVLRVVKLSPKWVPAKLNGKPIRSKVVVPFVFELK